MVVSQMDARLFLGGAPTGGAGARPDSHIKVRRSLVQKDVHMLETLTAPRPAVSISQVRARTAGH